MGRRTGALTGALPKAVELPGVECPRTLLGIEELTNVEVLPPLFYQNGGASNYQTFSESKGGKKMKKIQILGTGCPKCMKLTANAQEAAKQAGIEFEIEKVTEINKIMNYGVMMTPALAIDGQVKSVGKVLSPEEIKKLL